MLYITLFGTTTITTPNGIVHDEALGGHKPRQILEILALTPGIPVAKERLADLLWDGNPPRSFVGTLESYVCLLRRALGLSRGRASALRTVTHGYVLDAEHVRVDLAEFRSLVRQASAASQDPCAAQRRLKRAIGMVDGELLAGETYASWAAHEQAQFRGELVSACNLSARHALALSEPETAVEMSHHAVALDKFAEEAWRLLIRALADCGRESEALRAYAELRQHLATELGADPSPASSMLYLQILRAKTVENPGSGSDPHEEVRILVGLLREAVAAIPGMPHRCSDRALALVTADLVGSLSA